MATSGLPLDPPRSCGSRDIAPEVVESESESEREKARGRERVGRVVKGGRWREGDSRFEGV